MSASTQSGFKPGPPSELPRLISVDDHVIEPPHVWQEHLPERLRAGGPRVVRRRGRIQRTTRTWVLVEDDSADWADCWSYDDTLFAIPRGLASVSYPDGSQGGAGSFEEFRPGCYDQTARLADMDANHTEASLCFPTFPRFCGQTFLEAQDRDLALACVQAYNDWMIDDWCAGKGYGRLIPLTLVPLWDAELAAAEVRRCATKGSRAITFSEGPYHLGLPSVFTDFWEPLWAACDETATVVSVHIGSSSTFITTSPDAPNLVLTSLPHQSAQRTLVDWLASGILERYPSVKLALSEGQAGWMPFLVEYMDRQYHQGHAQTSPLSAPPSSCVAGRVYPCIFEDLTALRLRGEIGMNQIMIETDYPHNDTTWPNTVDILNRLIAEADLSESEIRRLLRGNAIECYGLDRLGLVP